MRNVKLICGILVVTMCLGLFAACKADAPDDSTTNSTTELTTVETTTEPTTEAPTETTTEVTTAKATTTTKKAVQKVTTTEAPETSEAPDVPERFYPTDLNNLIYDKNNLPPIPGPGRMVTPEQCAQFKLGMTYDESVAILGVPNNIYPRGDVRTPDDVMPDKFLACWHTKDTPHLAIYGQRWEYPSLSVEFILINGVLTSTEVNDPVF